jgi:mRNA interferase HicA
MRLPSMTPKKFVRTIKQTGFVEKRQVGSHLSLENAEGRTIVVPMHNRELKRGMLMALIKDAGLTQDEFMKFL